LSFRLSVTAFLLLAGQLWLRAQAPADSGEPPPEKPKLTEAQELANQVNNPAAPLSQLQFRDVLLPSVPGTQGAVNAFQIQPIVPIGPFHSFPVVQLVKMTIPFNSLPLAGVPPVVSETGIGDIALVDLFTFSAKWGKWGFGPSFVFPSASSPLLGAGKWQLGPSAALIYTGVKNLTAGVVAQNPISFAGSPDRAKQNNLIITPTLTYNMKKGWFAGLGDFNWNFNWENGGAALVPLAFQVGKVVRIGRQPCSISFEIGGAVARPAGMPNPGVIMGFEFTPIFNYHVGPGEKIRLRSKK
jgi:hypothetical protein